MKLRVKLRAVNKARALIIKNAESLLQESELLFKHGFYPRAFFCAHTAGEEVSKLAMLATIALSTIQKSNVHLEKALKRLRKHTAKTVGISRFFYTGSIFKLYKNTKKILKAIHFTSHLLRLREDSLYVSYRNGDIYYPKALFTKSFVKAYIILINKRLKEFKKSEILRGPYRFSKWLESVDLQKIENDVKQLRKAFQHKDTPKGSTAG